MSPVSSGADTGSSDRLPPLPRLIAELPNDLLELALTHSSWVGDRNASYERLEFLGDSVLGLSVAAHLYQRFPREKEGDLARWKAFVVSRGSCQVVACRVGVDGLVLSRAPGDAAQRTELAAAPTALGNLLEALIGACYLAHGFERTKDAVIDAFYDQVSYAVNGYIDYKSTLQEHLAAEGGRVASYALVGEDGPPHERVFTSEVVVDERVLGRGSGRSIKKSEQKAAREALVTLGVLPLSALEAEDEYLSDEGIACRAVDDGE